jgi:predicted transglutaminase-like cysteine proteinase
VRVNETVNRAIRPRHDAGADVWTVGARAGDCEDYALEKRRQLIEAGLPASALRLAYVKTRAGAGHAVLVINTPGVAYVLDNLTAAIRPLQQTGYRVISMQGADPDIWI